MVRGGRAYAKAPGQACASVCGSVRPEVSGTPAERSSRSRAGREDSAGEGGQLR